MSSLSLPDPRKGEQLVCSSPTRRTRARTRSLRTPASEGFPELWVPKALLVVPAIPVLASGKIDLQATHELAAQPRPPV